MAEDQDIWECLFDYLNQAQDKAQNDDSEIVSYSKGIPNVAIDPLSIGEQYPRVEIATRMPDGIIPSSYKMQSQKMVKFQEFRDELIDEIDEFYQEDQLEDIRQIYLQSNLKQRDYEFTNILPFMQDELALNPGIETVLYTNHDMFSGEIESVSSAYLHTDLKSFSTTNIINRGQLIKDKRGPEKVELGDKLLSLEKLEQQIQGLADSVFLQSQQIQQERDIRRQERVVEYQQRIEYIDDKFVKDQIQSIIHTFPSQSDPKFNTIWSLFIDEQKEEQKPIQQQKPKQIETLEDLEFQENAIVSESDIQMLSTLTELQRQARETAKINNIANDADDEEIKEEQNTIVKAKQIVDFNQIDNEPTFIDQMYYAEKAEPEIQEQDPEIRKQIQDALQVKSKFRIIKVQDIINNSNKLIEDRDYRFAVEDETDMSNFYDQLPKAKMAKQFQFELDDFQKRSILHLEKKESVFVCAHTSAGKTVIAEYAIALAFKHNRRALYTSPIKALSNQKFREFDQKFGNTGVVTGDVSINPGAPCLILTTEILRNMLYRGAELIRDIEWVIFDEVHYVNDQERGMVWEETIIMLPQHIGIIMLSATVPNYMDFANWVGRTRKQKVFVMKTFTRPVPLEHHIFVFDKFHTIKERDGDFLAQEYNGLKKKIKEIEDEKKGLKERIKKNMDEKKDDELYKNTNKSMRQKLTQKQIKSKFIQNISAANMKQKDEKRAMTQLIRLCEKKDLLPCVIFVFSRKKINELADSITKQNSLKLIDHKTEARIIGFFDQALLKLKSQDRQSPQLIRLRELLRFGIAIHHGHLLPIAKEIVEILFSEGLIKVLFATETFAMGINMPTKTVIFHSVEKFDGSNTKRMLHSSEYTQMSGRAGRRGIDEKGNVIIYIKDAQNLPDELRMKQMVDSKGLQLDSKFKITYSIILNLLTSKDIDATEMMKRSFHENYRFVQLPKQMLSLERLKKEYINTSLIQCPYQKGLRSGVSKSLIEEYVEIQKNYRFSQIGFIQQAITQSKTNITFPRFVLFSDHFGEISLGVALSQDYLNDDIYDQNYVLRPQEITQFNFSVLTIHSGNEDEKQQRRYKKIYLQYQTQFLEKKKEKQRNNQLKSNREFYYIINSVTEESIIDFLDDQIKASNKTNFLNIEVYYEDYATQLLEKQQQFQDMKQMLQYIYAPQQQNNNKKRQAVLTKFKYKFKSNKQQNDEENVEQFKFREEQLNELINQQCQFCDLKDKHLQQLQLKEKLKNDMLDIKKKIQGNDNQSQSDFNNKLNALKLLGYVDQAGLPLIKARIARELMDQSSIYICEVLVDNIMETLKPSEIAALMSAFVCQDRRKFDEEFDESNIEVMLHKKFDEISLELSGAIIATYVLIKKTIEEEMKMDAVDSKDSSEQIKNVLNFNLTQVIYLWAQGQSFVDVCLQTDIEEGSIVRTIQRLENMLRGVINAFRVMGNLKMVDKVEKACLLIKKDIVFAESLYFDSNAKIKEKN
ncbi:unnamed protein product [Paramecium octaurelia]|uniref:Uncharacterized protein n=1 Tax=Paramecium octaurelia TaxID=43137 RepID=A0A8S1SX09_PAROT|nr:unnamed protein product [Paramecium octaurelia]